MSLLERTLEKFARIQYKYRFAILALAAIISLFMAFGIMRIGIQSDMDEMMPQQLPIYQLNERIRDTFTGQDTIFILFTLKEGTRDVPRDIMDGEVLEYVDRLSASLNRESKIDEVVSVAPLVEAVRRMDPSLSAQSVQRVFEQSPESQQLVSDDRSRMIMMVRANVGSGEESVQDFTEIIEEKLEAYSEPAGTDIMLTGSAPLRVTIVDILRHDAVFTLIIAFLIILALLVVLLRSFTDPLLISVPLLVGILWTGGTLGWLGVKLSFATAGLGAMLLGLGVEYGVFMLSRYREARTSNNIEESMFVAVPAVGSAILGSGTTTIVGFLALTLSITPMMQNLGFSLALGIFYCIISAVVIEPVVIEVTERIR